MRFPAVLATALAVSALIYAGLRFSSPSATDTPQPTAGMPQTEAVATPKRSLAAPSRPFVMRSNRAAQAAPQPKRKAKVAAERKTPVTSAVANNLATGDTPLPSAPPVAVAPSQPNPKDQRWIGELSGGGARLKMSQNRQDLSCPSTPCQRPENPKDIKIVGVRVQTTRLVDAPMAPMDGKLKRGHYAAGTPALYVE